MLVENDENNVDTQLLLMNVLMNVANVFTLWMADEFYLSMAQGKEDQDLKIESIEIVKDQPFDLRSMNLYRFKSSQNIFHNDKIQNTCSKVSETWLMFV